VIIVSELIDNQSKRQQKLKELIQRLHRGEDRQLVEEEFKREFAYVTGAEIAQMEYNLVQEGVSIEEIQSLCDVHASLFKGTLQQLHSDMLTVDPLSEFEEDNKKIAQWVEEAKAFKEKEDLSFEEAQSYIMGLADSFNFAQQHYAKKENILFPFLEKRGIETIPQVMWGVDNQIRDAIKKTIMAANSETDLDALLEPFHEAIHMIDEMLTKENSILFPMLREKLKDDEYKDIALSLENGANSKYNPPVSDESSDVGDIPMSLGRLNPSEINAIFNAVPFDMTFVDAQDKVKFVTQGKERIFDRPPSVINRPVHLCHPPQSVDVVMDIVNDFRNGVKDNEDFWIQFRERFVHIRYFAIRDALGKFLGTLEVTQDITDIQRLIGEKRLVEK
jgi:uncharacterized protein